jgi:short-subunit dehydrogenase
LVGRDKSKLDLIAQDLLIRSPQTIIDMHTCDFLTPENIKALVDEICVKVTPDIVLIAHGSLPDQLACQQDLVMSQKVIQINAISPVLFAECFVAYMEKANQGKLAIISSVAGDRGRKSNYVYGSAKALVTRYAQGLQHRLEKTQVKVILIKPGPTATPMTSAINYSGKKMADVETVSLAIVSGIKKSRQVVYTPSKWVLIMMVIRHLPNFIFNKMDI